MVRYFQYFIFLFSSCLFLLKFLHESSVLVLNELPRSEGVFSFVFLFLAFNFFLSWMTFLSMNFYHDYCSSKDSPVLL